MPINFFDEDAKTSSSNIQFGLCDDSATTNPAYIDEVDKAKWIGIVNNQTIISANFYPIDNCIPIRRANGEMESRCDGMLLLGNILIFVELKSRESQGWISDGRGQLTITIQKFKENHDIAAFTTVEAYICNSLRPMASKNYAIEIQKFKDSTGLILNVQQNIDI